ncbi:hypothetical protein Nepgr_010529 [Nepenthes gracilis]|uniref:Uncharacterized protein n=1 Tax=Nepenthes gracilis TaxID=150966 RepID=A0AAD3SDJ2_NEPGR|nr:hypothetical protein Nepgr_010529 [Nepenthes gracilis]
MTEFVRRWKGLQVGKNGRDFQCSVPQQSARHLAQQPASLRVAVRSSATRGTPLTLRGLSRRRIQCPQDRLLGPGAGHTCPAERIVVVGSDSYRLGTQSEITVCGLRALRNCPFE